MSEQELRTLIRGIVAEMLAEQARPTKPNALVLFTGALLGFETALESLKRLSGEVNLDYTQTPSATRILDQEAIAGAGLTPADKSLVQAHDLLIVPTATVNMIAKVVHGVGDCLASNVLAEFIMSGKPVVLVTNAACPDSADKRGWFPAMPAGYQAMLRQNLETLKSFGVRLTSAEKLDQAVLKKLAPAAAAQSTRVDCSEPVIHETLVKSLTPGTVLRVGRSALITALARDVAESTDITIERA